MNARWFTTLPIAAASLVGGDDGVRSGCSKAQCAAGSSAWSCRRLRDAAGKIQQNAAEWLGIPATGISKMESG
jgi:hypothetical protein